MAYKNEIAKLSRQDQNDVQVFLENNQDLIAGVLPKSLNPERFLRIALSQFRKNPKLLQCSQESVMAGLLTSAQLGLEIGINGLCWLIPYKSEANFQIGFQGWIELAYRTGIFNGLVANPVYPSDTFEESFGINATFYHKTNRHLRKENEKPILYYAYALVAGSPTWFVMSIAELEKVRNTSQDYKFKGNSSIWSNHFDAMARKTCIIRLIKYVPKSSVINNQSGFSIADALNVDNAKMLSVDRVTKEVISEHEYEQEQLEEPKTKPKTELKSKEKEQLPPPKLTLEEKNDVEKTIGIEAVAQLEKTGVKMTEKRKTELRKKLTQEKLSKK